MQRAGFATQHISASSAGCHLAIPKYQHSQSKHIPVVVGRQGLEGPGWIHHSGRRRGHGAYLWPSPPTVSGSWISSRPSHVFDLTRYRALTPAPQFSETSERRCMTPGYDSGLSHLSPPTKLPCLLAASGQFLQMQQASGKTSWTATWYIDCSQSNFTEPMQLISLSPSLSPHWRKVYYEHCKCSISTNAAAASGKAWTAWYW